MPRTRSQSINNTNHNNSISSKSGYNKVSLVESISHDEVPSLPPSSISNNDELLESDNDDVDGRTIMKYNFNDVSFITNNTNTTHNTLSRNHSFSETKYNINFQKHTSIQEQSSRSEPYRYRLRSYTNTQSQSQSQSQDTQILSNSQDQINGNNNDMNNRTRDRNYEIQHVTDDDLYSSPIGKYSTAVLATTPLFLNDDEIQTPIANQVMSDDDDDEDNLLTPQVEVFHSFILEESDDDSNNTVNTNTKTKNKSPTNNNNTTQKNNKTSQKKRTRSKRKRKSSSSSDDDNDIDIKFENGKLTCTPITIKKPKLTEKDFPLLPNPKLFAKNISTRKHWRYRLTPRCQNAFDQIVKRHFKVMINLANIGDEPKSSSRK